MDGGHPEDFDVLIRYSSTFNEMPCTYQWLGNLVSYLRKDPAPLSAKAGPAPV